MLNWSSKQLKENGHFCCTDCYIRIGMPKRKARTTLFDYAL